MKVIARTLRPEGISPFACRSLGRVLLACLIAVSLTLSFFHDWSPTDDPGATSGMSITVAVDTSTNAPVQHAPVQGDHCLTHLVSQASQKPLLIPAGFGGLIYLAHDEQVPVGADQLSPFKPPCV
jgi:hypothetical protein